MTPALIVTHGALGRSLMEAVENTLGPQSAVEVLSNEGLSLDQMIAAVESRLGATPSVLFADHCGGSPFIACKSLHTRHAHHVVITGVNLPMLLSFFTKRDQLPFAELVAAVEADGHRGIQRISV